MLLMDGKREDGIVVTKDVGSAVAMVDIGVDDDRFFYQAVGLQATNRNGDVMNSAKAFAVIRMRMVEATG